MFIGALGAGIVTTVMIELIHKKTRVKQDSAIGITFSTLFAIGVILISFGQTDAVHLDAECVLYGEIGFVPLVLVQTELGPGALSVVEKIPGLNSEMFLDGNLLTIAPPSVIRMAIVTGMTLLLILVFYKELLVTSFDSGLSSSLGINSTVVHYALMGMLSVIIVSAFEAVGAILVIAMLILPGATASLLAYRKVAADVWHHRHTRRAERGGRHSFGHVAEVFGGGCDGGGRLGVVRVGVGVQSKPRAASALVRPQVGGARCGSHRTLGQGGLNSFKFSVSSWDTDFTDFHFFLSIGVHSRPFSRTKTRLGIKKGTLSSPFKFVVAWFRRRPFSKCAWAAC